MEESEDIRSIEVRLFLEALRLRHGYDFTHYAQASILRRLDGLLAATGQRHLSELIPRLLHGPDLLPTVLSHLSVPVTGMFRDPQVFLALREKVVPLLKTWPHVRIWQAGCATGEEVYSLAILLREEGLAERYQIYATDINEEALAKAEEGIVPLKTMQEYARNYRAAGGNGSLSDYCHIRYDFAKFDESLRSNIVFAHHNVVSDGIFSETHLILCRNLLIYFDRDLQSRVLSLFHDSLVRGGFLCLGTRETVAYSRVAENFTVVDKDCRIFRSDGRVAEEMT